MLSMHKKAISEMKSKKKRSKSWRQAIPMRAIFFVFLSLLILGLSIVSTHITINYKSYLTPKINLSQASSYARPFRPRVLADPPPQVDDHGDDHGDDHVDDHGDDHAFSLFGAITGLTIFAGTVSVLIIIAAVQTTDYMFHLLHNVTHDTPFNQMVQSIEKELMVVGFTAFAFKIMVDTTSFLDLEWFHSLEYADILVPLFSFAYCGLGIMLILNSIKISTLWSQAYHLSLTEALDHYYKLPGFVGYFPYGLWLAPITPAIAKVEFRIFQNIFCETYKIQKAAFAFNEYVEKVFEKYVLTIIQIRWSDWVALCSLVLLNWARNKMRLDFIHCSSHDLVCEEENNTIMFCIAGAAICGMTFFMALESRRLEVSIMRQKGIRSIHMYPSYLKYMEESEEAQELDKFRLSKEELKVSAEGVKYNAINADLVEHEELEQERQSARMLDQLKHSVPGFSISIATDKHGGASSHGGAYSGKGGSNSANKFSASVKKAWKSKKQVSKRRRSVNVLGGDTRLARRTSLIGGMGFPNLAHLAALRAKHAERIATEEALKEEDEESDSSDGCSSGELSSAPSDDSSGSDSGSEEFDPHAAPKRKKKKKMSSEDGEEVSNNIPVSIEETRNIPQAAVPKRLPPIGVSRWKAAPAQNHRSLPHVFSRIQKHIDSVIGSNSSNSSNRAELYREGGDNTQEDSKLSWAEGSGALRKKQLPPIRAAPSGDVTSIVAHSSSTVLCSDAAPSPLAGLSAEALLHARISPARLSGKHLVPAMQERGSPGVSGKGRIAVIQPLTSNRASPVHDSPGSVGSRKTLRFDAAVNLHGPVIASAVPVTGVRLSGRGSGVKKGGGSSKAKNTPTVETALKEPAATLPATRGHPAPMPPVATHSQEEDDEAQEVPIADVFFLSWPELYLEGVQSLIMIIAVYCALYFTNFVTAASTDAWKFITFLPALICAILLVYIVKSAVMLGAIHAVDCDAILEVLEQTEGARILSELIKEKVIGLLSEMGPDPQAELVNLFSEIDSDGSGSISRDEFAEYMNSIEIHFDRRRWMQVFRGIDTTFDNKITFEEFYVFLFPDHTLGQAMKDRRDKALRNHMRLKSEQRTLQLNRFTNGPSRMTFLPPVRKTTAT